MSGYSGASRHSPACSSSRRSTLPPTVRQTMPLPIPTSSCCRAAVGFAFLLFSGTLGAAEPTITDVPYATVDGQRLTLALYHPPDTAAPSPLVVWVHGGAWRAGSKADVPIARLVDDGFAIASIDYRLSPVAPFPAQVHDIKAAIRFLRAHAQRYRLDPQRIAIAGSSAGGHLAALTGVTNSAEELEGTVGGFLSQSADVRAIVSFYGASNLQSILAQSTPHGLGVRVPALQLLLGGQPDEKPALARLASPVAHVGPGDPPLLLIHGDQDPQMPLAQSEDLQRAYQQHALPVQLRIVPGGVHGGRGFFEPPMLRTVAQFLSQHL